MTIERSTASRDVSPETRALIMAIHAMRRKFNAAVERRDQSAGRLDDLGSERKSQRWLNTVHPAQWYRQRIAGEQRKLASAQADIKLLGDQHDEMMESLKQANTRDAVARINATKAPVQSPRTPPIGARAS